MGELLDLVRQASQTAFTSEDGDPAPLELEPPLEEGEIRELEARLPCALPADVRELLGFCSGFAGGAVEVVDFTGQECVFEFDSAFPHGLPVAADGFGNFWVVDLHPTSSEWGPIYFSCHDAPVILYQSKTLAEFLSELFKLSVPPYASLVDDVHEDLLFDVWRKNPGVIEHAECVAASDPSLRSFAEQLGPTYQFIDLRNPTPGMGFSWGRYGPKTVVKRCGELPLFAYEKKKGWLSRMFGTSD